MRDTYRHMEPDGRDYTHRHTHSRHIDQDDLTPDTPNHDATDPTCEEHAPRYTWRRLDRIYASRSLLKPDGTPRVRSVRHLKPTDAQLLALRQLGSTSKWSDHCAVQLTMQYTNTPRATPRWSVPRSLLKSPRLVNGVFRAKADKLLNTIDGGTSAAATLETYLNDTKQTIRSHTTQTARTHNQRLQRLHKRLEVIEGLV